MRRGRVQSTDASLASPAVMGEVCGKGKPSARRTSTILSAVTGSGNSLKAKALYALPLLGGA